MVAEFSCPFQESDIIHSHATCPLQQRLDDKAIQPVVILCESLFKRLDLGGDMNDIFAFAVCLQNKMVVLVIAHLHGLEGISVIGVFQRQHHGAPGFFPVHIILQGNFKGNFHRNAAGIREEAIVQIPRQPALELGGKLFCRFMGQAAQHYMGKFLQLHFDRLIEFRMLVSVDHAPPGRHGINQFLIFGIQIDPFCINDLIGGLHRFHLLIRKPDHLLSPPFSS